MTLNYSLTIKEYEQALLHEKDGVKTPLSSRMMIFIKMLVLALIVFVQNAIIVNPPEGTVAPFAAYILLPVLFILCGILWSLSLNENIAVHLTKQMKREKKKSANKCIPWEAPVQIMLTENGLKHDKHCISTFFPPNAITKMYVDCGLIYLHGA